MNGLLGALTAGTKVHSARFVLNLLMDSVGSAGLAAAAGQPGLLAMVDQHAAALRDRLLGNPAKTGDNGGGISFSVDRLAVRQQSLTPEALAGYAEGVGDAAMTHGWQAPTGPVDWSEPDWVLLRLLAVCALAHDLLAR